ncbi:MAG: hypothetical protein U0S12_12740 [Fimbriimonadales bacterium]
MSVNYGPDGAFAMRFMGIALFVVIALGITSRKSVYNVVTFSFRRFTSRSEQDIHAIYDGFRGAIPASFVVLFADFVKPVPFLGILFAAAAVGYLIGSWKSPRRLY